MADPFENAKLTSRETLLQEQEAQVKRLTANLAREQAEVRRVQERLHALQNEVDKLSDQVTQAEFQFESFKRQLETLNESLLEGWGNPAIPTGPSYHEIARLRATIDDFPRVKAISRRSSRQRSARSPSSSKGSSSD